MSARKSRSCSTGTPSCWALRSLAAPALAPASTALVRLLTEPATCAPWRCSSTSSCSLLPSSAAPAARKQQQRGHAQVSQQVNVHAGACSQLCACSQARGRTACHRMVAQQALAVTAGRYEAITGITLRCRGPAWPAEDVVAGRAAHCTSACSSPSQCTSPAPVSTNTMPASTPSPGVGGTPSLLEPEVASLSTSPPVALLLPCWDACSGAAPAALLLLPVLLGACSACAPLPSCSAVSPASLSCCSSCWLAGCAAHVGMFATAGAGMLCACGSVRACQHTPWRRTQHAASSQQSAPLHWMISLHAILQHSCCVLHILMQCQLGMIMHTCCTQRCWSSYMQHCRPTPTARSSPSPSAAPPRRL